MVEFSPGMRHQSVSNSLTARSIRAELGQVCLGATLHIGRRRRNPDPWLFWCAVTDFREARCRSYDEATCNRGGHCNFLHLMPVSRR